MKTWDKAMKSGGLDSYANYIGSHDYKDWVMFLGRTRDSDTYERSNFECGLKAIGGESDTVHIVGFGHWACGWIDEIMIDPKDTEAIKKAEQVLSDLEDYPIVNEDHHSELEYTEVSDYWANMSVGERMDICVDNDISIFSARRDYLPQDDDGSLYDSLRD